MQILIRTNGFSLSSSLGNFIYNRAGVNFSRFGATIRKVEVYVADENGPKGGVDKTCVIKIKLDQSNEIVVKDVQDDLYIAIQRAVTRAKQALTKKRQKSKVFSRKRICNIEDFSEVLAIPQPDNAAATA